MTAHPSVVSIQCITVRNIVVSFYLVFLHFSNFHVSVISLNKQTEYTPCYDIIYDVNMDI